jgi:Tfp pilus assembly protein PilF
MIAKQLTIPLLLLTLLLSACSDSGTQTPRALDAAAIEANNHAVGLMGRFEYANAQAEFSSLATQWPQRTEFKINLAIATLNRQQAGDEEAALNLAREVIESDPTNLRAHYVAGLVHLYLGSTADALTEFSYVTDADPKDGHAAYYLAQSLAQTSDYSAALPWFERAMKLNPYLRSAYYGGFQSLQRLDRQQEAEAVAAQYQRLENNPRSVLAEFKYTRMGPKGDALAIDLPGKTVAARPTGALFTNPEPLIFDQAAAPRWLTPPTKRFSSFTTADMQGDGYPDLFIAGTIEVANEQGETTTGNLVLKGQGDGSFSVDEGSPLMTVDGVNAALWGDYDNDGLLDVYLCRDGLNQLWRQTATDRWQDMTESTMTAGADLDTVDGAFFDADHDGDLDLFLVNANGPNE